MAVAADAVGAVGAVAVVAAAAAAVGTGSVLAATTMKGRTGATTRPTASARPRQQLPLELRTLQLRSRVVLKQASLHCHERPVSPKLLC